MLSDMLNFPHPNVIGEIVNRWLLVIKLYKKQKIQHQTIYDVWKEILHMCSVKVDNYENITLMEEIFL